jgi:hypothetical protein
MSEGQWISLFAMMVSLMAMFIQLVFGVMAQRRAYRETERQIAETKKQEKLHAVNADETYKAEVRAWGRSVVRAMSAAQQLSKIDPTKFVTSDYDLHRAETVAVLRGLLDKAKWLFPNLAVPTREDEDWHDDHKRKLSSLEAILHAYHVLDTVKATDKTSRERAVVNIRNLRKLFVAEMRRAVDPHVRGEDIERIMAEVVDELNAEPPLPESVPAEPIGPGEASALRK